MTDPDLSPATAWLAARPPAERKRRGAWPTPWWLVAQVVERLDIAPGAVVVDPACGDGRWLLAVARKVPDARLVGIDADPLAIEAARRTLAAAGVTAALHAADALAEGAVPRCDWIVGNPPFVRPQQLGRTVGRDLWARFALATDKCDLAACFVERALQVAPRFALLLPGALLSLASWAAVRRAVAARGVGAVASTPRGAFGAAVDAVLVIADPADRRVAGACTVEGWRALGPAHLGPVWTLEEAPELPGAPFGDHVSLHMGIVCGDYPRYVHDRPQYPEDRPTCRGRDVGRWTIADRGEYVRYVPEEMLARKPYVAPKHAGLFDVPEKLVIAGTSGREIRAALDGERRFPLDSCYVAHPRRPDVDLHAALGLLLSTPVQGWYGRRFGAPRVKGVELAQIPAPSAGWAEIGEAARARDEAGLDAAVRAAYARTG